MSLIVTDTTLIQINLIRFSLPSLIKWIKSQIASKKIIKSHALIILPGNCIICTQLCGGYAAFGNRWHGQRSVIKVLQVCNGSQNLSLFTRKTPVRHVSFFIKDHLKCTYRWIKAQPCCFASLWGLRLKSFRQGIESIQKNMSLLIDLLHMSDDPIWINFTLALASFELMKLMTRFPPDFTHLWKMLQ